MKAGTSAPAMSWLPRFERGSPIGNSCEPKSAIDLSGMRPELAFSPRPPRRAHRDSLSEKAASRCKRTARRPD